VKESTQTVLGLAIVGGALWLYLRLRQPAAAPAPVATESPCGPVMTFANNVGRGVAAAYGVRVTDEQHAQNNTIICDVLDWVTHAFADAAREVGNFFTASCSEKLPSPEDLAKWEIKNRQLNGPGRGYTTNLLWIQCPHAYDPGRQFENGVANPRAITISYANGCSPLYFAPGRKRCAAGTHFYGPKNKQPELVEQCQRDDPCSDWEPGDRRRRTDRHTGVPLDCAQERRQGARTGRCYNGTPPIRWGAHPEWFGVSGLFAGAPTAAAALDAFARVDDLLPGKR
jgi:hypothetical protein